MAEERTLRYPIFHDRQKVQKKTGYRYPGFIRQFIYRGDGTVAYVVEADHPEFKGMLHIFSEEQLEPRLTPDDEEFGCADPVKLDAPTVLAIERVNELCTVHATFHGAPSVLATLERVYELCTVHAAPNAFHNGVTDSTGTIDEGDAHASDVLDEVKRAIAELRR